MFKFKGCRHIMPAGRRCHNPALRGMAYCYCHQKLHKTLNRSRHSHTRLALPSIEDHKGIQLAISQVCDALGKARIDEGKARVIMHGLQLATQIASKTPKPAPENCRAAAANPAAGAPCPSQLGTWETSKSASNHHGQANPPLSGGPPQTASDFAIRAPLTPPIAPLGPLL